MKAHDSIAVENPRYSIFLPVRNGADYIEQAVESVLNQSIEDWVLYVLDNNSSDRTVDIIKRFNDPRIQLQKSNVDLTIFDSWDRIRKVLASDEVKGKFVTILGHDDYFYPDFLKAADSLITKEPGASLYQIAVEIVGAKGELLRPCRPIPLVEQAEDFIAARLWGLRDSFGIGYVFRPKDFIKVGGWPELPLLLYADDLIFILLTALSYKAASTAPQCAFRLHRASTSASFDTMRVTKSLEALEQYLARLKLDFPNIYQSEGGKAAIACVLAREALLFDTPILRHLLPTSSRDLVDRLARSYRELFKNLDYRQFLGSNFIHRRVYPVARQTILALILLKNHLS